MSNISYTPEELLKPGVAQYPQLSESLKFLTVYHGTVLFWCPQSQSVRLLCTLDVKDSSLGLVWEAYPWIGNGYAA